MRPAYTSNFDCNPSTYHQGTLLIQAKEERGLEGEVRINHVDGRGRIGEQEYGVIYPDSFFARTEFLPQQPKVIEYLFIGYMSGPRAAILDAFKGRHPGTVIRSTDTGRNKSLKGKFDSAYYAEMARAKFGLCPHHPGWPGPRETMWTYRFVECCMVGAVPVLFREAPLCDDFIQGFHYVWDDEAGRVHPGYAMIEDNRKLAEGRFRLP